MRIRSITCFYNPNTPESQTIIQQFAKMKSSAIRKFEDAGYPVQTTRLSTTPFPHLLPELNPDAAGELAVRMEKIALEHSFEFLALGPALPELPESYALIPEMLKVTKSTFFGGVMASSEMGVNLAAVKACGEIIAQSAPLEPNGFGNLRFTALANVLPHTPFFPASYHAGNQPAFSLAIECADVVQEVFENAQSLAAAREDLVSTLEKHAEKLTEIANSLVDEFNIEFKGMDFSPAPYPADTCSLGCALEKLGPQKLGLNGSVAAAAFLADALDRGNWLRAGFNGLMLPVLEDAMLAQRSIDGTLTIKDLLLFSTVCGTGLDTVPLPGDASPEQLAAVLLDVAAISVRLAKPLTARLMPIPGKKAGEDTTFDFDYFANGRILDLPAEPLDRLFAGDETFLLYPRLKK